MATRSTQSLLQLCAWRSSPGRLRERNVRRLRRGHLLLALIDKKEERYTQLMAEDFVDIDGTVTHHDLTMAEVEETTPALTDEWSMKPRAIGLNHIVEHLPTAGEAAREDRTDNPVFGRSEVGASAGD